MEAWLDKGAGSCVLRDPACASIAQRAATTCYLGSIAAAVKRPLKFDPVAEKFIGDDEANTILIKPMRDAWKIA